MRNAGETGKFKGIQNSTAGYGICSEQYLQHDFKMV